MAERTVDNKNLSYHHSDPVTIPQDTGDANIEIPETIVRSGPKIGRNEPCHCGSGKKFKSCHGKLS